MKTYPLTPYVKNRLKVTLLLAVVIFSLVYFTQRPKSCFSIFKTQREIAGCQVTAVVMTKTDTPAEARRVTEEKITEFTGLGWRLVKKDIANGNQFDDFFTGFLKKKPASQSYVSYENASGCETRVYFSAGGNESERIAGDALGEYCRALRAADINDFRIVHSKKIISAKKK